MPFTDPLVVAVDLQDPGHQQAILELLDLYSREAGIAGKPLAPAARGRLIQGLRDQPAGRYFLAFSQQRAVGIALCFLGYSTFAARPLLNVHDLAVHPQFRGRGIGKALLATIEHAARQEGCCRLTLEVRADNRRARRLYQQVGFDAGNEETQMYFLTKELAQVQNSLPEL